MFTRKLFCAVALAASLATQSAAPALGRAAHVETTPYSAPADWQMFFNDEFDGQSLNTGKWRTCIFYTPVPAEGCIPDNETGWYLPANVSVSAGSVRMRAQQHYYTNSAGQSFQYTTGMLASHEQFGFTYGYVEMRARVPSEIGLLTSLWLHPVSNNGNVVWPPEIDLAEFPGPNDGTVYMTLHEPNGAGGSRTLQNTFRAGTPFNYDWHTFGVLWQPDLLVWYIDGVERSRMTGAVVPSQKMYALASLAVGSAWSGQPAAGTRFPAYLDLDYVRIWQAAAAPASANVRAQVNGTYASGASGGLAGWSIDALNLNTGAQITQVTDGGGQASFQLPAGNYRFCQRRPANWQALAGDCAWYSVGAGVSFTTRFNNSEVGQSAGATTFRFRVRTTNYEPFTGWRVDIYSLDNGGALTQNVYTDNQGLGAQSMPAGNYKICAAAQSGWRSLTPAGDCYWISVRAGDDVLLEYVLTL